MDHLDFDIDIGDQVGDEYPVGVRSPAGEGRSTLRLPFAGDALVNRLQAVQLALLSSAPGRRRVMGAEEQVVRDFGAALFDALFAGEVRHLLDASRVEAQTAGKGLRLKLRCRVADIGALPWEFLFDVNANEFICLSRHTPIVRYLEVPSPLEPLRVDAPLRVLGAVASPKDREPLDVAGERQRIEHALARAVAAGLVELDWLDKPTWRELQKALNEGTWHVFHFVGHGGFNEHTNEGVLVFEDDEGMSQMLGASDFGLLLGDHDPLRLAVLNACEGARGSSLDAFSSTAAVLVRKGTPGVVAMQYQISDQASLELARAFYEGVAAGLPVDTALAEARKAVRLSLPGSLEWGTPVLFMRASDGVLFRVDPSTAEPTVPAIGLLPTMPAGTGRPAVPPQPSEEPSRRARGRGRREEPGGAPGPGLVHRLRRRVDRRVAMVAGLVVAALVAGVVAYKVIDDGGGGGGGATAGAASAGLAEPHGITVDPEGRLIVGDFGNERVVEIVDGKAVVLAGGTESSDSGDIGDGGLAVDAYLDAPWAVVVGPDGTLYIGDQGTGTIRRVRDGIIDTIHTRPFETYLGTEDMDITSNGDLVLVAGNQVWRIGPDDTLEVIAGQAAAGDAGDGGPAADALLKEPAGIAAAPDGSIYVADSQNLKVRRINVDGTIETVAGSGDYGDAFPGTDPMQVNLGTPHDVALDRAGNLYILNSNPPSIVRVSPERVVTVVLPGHEFGFAGDGGPVAEARFGEIRDMALDDDGNIYVLDFMNNRVRQIATDGIVTTVG